MQTDESHRLTRRCWRWAAQPQAWEIIGKMKGYSHVLCIWEGDVSTTAWLYSFLVETQHPDKQGWETLCDMLFNCSFKSKFCSFQIPKQFQGKKMLWLQWTLSHWHSDHRFSGFLSIFLFVEYSTTKIQRHFEELPFVYPTVTSKQVPVQQFKHPRCALHIIRPDTLSILDEPSASLSLTKLFLPKK